MVTRRFACTTPRHGGLPLVRRKNRAEQGFFVSSGGLVKTKLNTALPRSNFVSCVNFTYSSRCNISRETDFATGAWAR